MLSTPAALLFTARASDSDAAPDATENGGHPALHGQGADVLVGGLYHNHHSRPHRWVSSGGDEVASF